MTPREALDELRRSAPASSAGRVRCDRSGGVAVVRLDHPAARSAVTFRMMIELAEIVVDLADFDGHAVVVASTDPACFCAGGHLGELLAHLSDPGRAAAMARAMTAVLDGLRDLPPPTFAAVHALAVGGGAELATAADFRVLAPTASVHFVHTRLGVVPGWGGADRLRRIVGERTALRWLAAAAPVDAEGCLRAGFADALDADPLAAACAEAAAFAGRAEAVRAAKAQLRSPASAPELFAGLWGGAAHRQALASRGR